MNKHQAGFYAEHPAFLAQDRRRRAKGFAKYWRHKPTEPEKVIQLALQEDSRFANISWVRQKVLSGFILDFYFPVKRLSIELDGPNHRYSHRAFKDEIRSYDLRNAGITELRFTNEVALANPKEVVDKIFEAYQKLPDAYLVTPKMETLMKEKSRTSFINPEPLNV